MGKPILYGFDISPPVRSVLLTAHAIDLDYEFREVNPYAGEHLSEEYLQKNPQHTIPTLQDGTKYIWDSHAIALYLIQKYGKDDNLYPNDLYKRAVIDQRLHFDSGVLFSCSANIMKIFRATGSVPEEGKEKLLEAYAFLEKFLAVDLYLAGNAVTVADLCCVATISSLNLLVPIRASKFEKLTQWLERMMQLPYYEKANGTGLAKGAELMGKMLNNSQK